MKKRLANCTMIKITSSITKSSKGFTLTELMTVMVVIAVLISIAVPIYNQTQQTTKDRVDEANIRILNGATLQWINKSEANDITAQDTESLRGELENIFIQEWPTSPNEDKEYILEDGVWKINNK